MSFEEDELSTKKKGKLDQQQRTLQQFSVVGDISSDWELLQSRSAHRRGVIVFERRFGANTVTQFPMLQRLRKQPSASAATECAWLLAANLAGWHGDSSMTTVPMTTRKQI